MDNLKPHMTKQLHEVADLMLDIYHTLVRMRYLDPSWIIEGPHNVDSLIPMYQSYDLDASIIYLYSILPYIEVPDGSRMDFFQGGAFADFRQKEDVERSRDPFYSDEEDEAMLPWMTPLSMLGNHRSVIIYSAKYHRIWILDHESGGSADHNINEGFLSAEEHERLQEERKKEEESNGGVSEDEEDEEDEEEEEDEEDEEDDEDGEDEDEDDEDEDNSNWDKDSGRPAGKVLRDIVKWYHELIELPGDGDEAGPVWDKDILLSLYPKHGWPSADFDGDAFQIDQVRAAAVKEIKGDAQEQIYEVHRCNMDVNDDTGYRNRQRADLLAKEAAATTDDELWIARWELWKWEQHSEYLIEKLKMAEEVLHRESPHGQCRNLDELPLWEERQLRMEYWTKLRELKSAQQAEEQPHASELKKGIQFYLRQAEEQAAIYQKAYEAARVDAERLFPGRLLPVRLGVEVDGTDYEKSMENLTTLIERLQKSLKPKREWIVQVPNSAQHARQVLQNEIDREEKSLERYERERSEVIRKIEEIKAGIS
ncbi:hypothetical protein V494_03006 [Pseudogymnoascus sp. VKM F-4513 (FW-928)]|nr:hypothetical protein V494_03006 [Pseudogymnoascus sp. VKM F-4513 (FW-928)]